MRLVLPSCTSPPAPDSEVQRTPQIGARASTRYDSPAALPAVARAPERAIRDPNNERNLPLISKAASTAYEEQQADR